MRVFFLSIGGTGMGQAALLLRSRGHEVAGSDRNLYPPMSDLLADAGIPIGETGDLDYLRAWRPDLVVVGNVNTRLQPEIEWLLDERPVPFTSLPALLHDFVLARRRNIVVTGTHGKTTTACLTAVLLRGNGRQPGWFIGGVPRDLPGGSELGAVTDPFVIEGDEYDSAFFDKRSKFIHYAPHVLTINNLEFDHADIFRDLDDVRRSFSHLIRLVPRSGHILLNADETTQRPLLPIAWTRTWSVGLEETADLRIVDFTEGPDGSAFDLRWQGKPWGSIAWGQGGVYNARNAAMAALAAGLSLWPDDPTRLSLEPLRSFHGVKRRMEVFHDDGRVALLSDFAHHPTAVAAALRSLRARYPGRQLTACFEARSNTTCRGVFQREFGEALALADRVHLGTVYRADRYLNGRLDMGVLAAHIGPAATAHPDNPAIAPALLAELRDGREHAVVFFSNGSFDGLMPAVVQGLTA